MVQPRRDGILSMRAYTVESYFQCLRIVNTIFSLSFNQEDEKECRSMRLYYPSTSKTCSKGYYAKALSNLR